MNKILLYGEDADKYVKDDLINADGEIINPDYVERFKSINSNAGATLSCYSITKRISLYVLYNVDFDNNGNINDGNVSMVSTDKNECLNECRRGHLQCEEWFKAHYGDKSMFPEEF